MSGETHACLIAVSLLKWGLIQVCRTEMGLGEPVTGCMAEIIGGLAGDLHGAVLGRLACNLVALVGCVPTIDDEGCDFLDIVLSLHFKELLTGLRDAFRSACRIYYSCITNRRQDPFGKTA